VLVGLGWVYLDVMVWWCWWWCWSGYRWVGLVGFNIGVDLCLPFFCSCGIYLLLFSVCSIFVGGVVVLLCRGCFLLCVSC